MCVVRCVPLKGVLFQVYPRKPSGSQSYCIIYEVNKSVLLIFMWHCKTFHTPPPSTNKEYSTQGLGGNPRQKQEWWHFVMIMILGFPFLWHFLRLWHARFYDTGRSWQRKCDYEFICPVKTKVLTSLNIGNEKWKYEFAKNYI